MPEIFAIEFPTYLPAMRIITSITQAVEAVVTTSFDHDYVSGEIVRITMPQEHGHWTWGMFQINDQQGIIEVLSPTTFSISIDTTYYDPFITPVGPDTTRKQRPYVVPIGEINQILTAATRNVL